MDCIFKLREQLEVIWKHLDNHSIKATKENKLISAMLFVSLNHCDAIQLLLQKKNIASSFALVRPVLETTFRSVWLHRCADKNQINRCIESDKWPQTWKLADEIEKTRGNAAVFSKIWSSLRGVLPSYSHGGLQNAVRQLGNGNLITPNVDNDEIHQVVQIVGLLSFTIFAEYIDLFKNEALFPVLEELSEKLQIWAFKK